jgi:rRNA maturation endonuclease Nob1
MPDTATHVCRYCREHQGPGDDCRFCGGPLRRRRKDDERNGF